MINIALLGFGTVGKGAYEILTNKKDSIKKVVGEEVQVKKILKRNLNFKTEIDKSLFTDDFEDIISDENIKLVVEMTGDVEKSYIYIKRALNAKKHVVTANKGVVSEYFEEFLEIADRNKVAFLYEAAVAGSIPIITPLKSQVITNDISRVRGILNGTSNFLLTNMQVRKSKYDEILREAQDLGYAEADPYDDVEGVDALRKLRILSTIAFKSSIKNEEILCRGMSTIDLNDILYLEKHRQKIKLIAESRMEDGAFKSVVEPVILEVGDELYGIDGAENIVEIYGENYGSLSFAGEGAGSLPTGNAIVSDVIDALAGNYYPVEITRHLENKSSDIYAKYYIRINRKINLDGENWVSYWENHEDYTIVNTDSIKRSFLLDKIKELNLSENEYFFARFN